MAFRIQQTMSGTRAASRRGVALPAALFGLVTVTILASAIFAATTVQSSSTRNRESSARALQLAEDGLAHAVTVVRDSLKGQPYTRLLRGSDNVASTATTADDGRITGFGMSSAITIPVAGRTFGSGSYTAVITDDNDGDGNLKADVNFRVKLTCTATTTDGGTASLDVVIGTDVIPAIASNGDIALSGTPQIKGYCGSVHANDDLTITGSGGAVVAAGITAHGTVSGTVKDTLGITKSPIGGRDTISIPAMSYPQFCGAAGTNATTNLTNVELWLTSTGAIYRRGSAIPTLTAVTSATKYLGWWWTASTKTWNFATGGTLAPGLVCAEGNVDISGNVGTATMPMQMSIVATGSVKVSGTPYLVPATGDSISIVSGGDVWVSGNPATGATSFEGLIYANAQCYVSGQPSIRGQVLCKDEPTGTGNTEYIATTTITGSATITYGCGGIHSRRRIYSWLQRVE